MVVCGLFVHRAMINHPWFIPIPMHAFKSWMLKVLDGPWETVRVDRGPWAHRR